MESESGFEALEKAAKIDGGEFISLDGHMAAAGKLSAPSTSFQRQKNKVIIGGKIDV